jgi:hypothetical protein
MPVRSRRETMEHDPGCLVRYGLMGHVGRFPFESAAGESLERGQAVVVRTDRGLELGEVLVSPGPSIPSRRTGAGWPDRGTGGRGEGKDELDQSQPRVVRPASPADLECAGRSLALRPERFSTCREILDEAGWALDLLDVEPLLDQSTTVLHVLGPGNLDLALLRARFRSLSNFDVVFEAVGSGAVLEAEWMLGSTSAASRGRCGDCDCSAGECGRALRRTSDAVTDSEPIPAASTESPSGACGSSAHSGCASCVVTRYRREPRAS